LASTATGPQQCRPGWPSPLQEGPTRTSKNQGTVRPFEIHRGGKTEEEKRVELQNGRIHGIAQSHTKTKAAHGSSPSPKGTGHKNEKCAKTGTDSNKQNRCQRSLPSGWEASRNTGAAKLGQIEKSRAGQQDILRKPDSVEETKRRSSAAQGQTKKKKPQKKKENENKQRGKSHEE